MKYWAIIISVIVLVGCASTRHTYTTRVNRDSTYIVKNKLDSLIRLITQRDSIYLRDSIYIKEKGDTVLKYVERIRYRYKINNDTLYRDRIVHDTIYINRADTATVGKLIYKDKPIKWYNRAFIWCGKLCCLAAILWILFLFIKRKF